MSLDNIHATFSRYFCANLAEARGVKLKGKRNVINSGRDLRGIRKGEAESTHFIETFTSLRSRKLVRIFVYCKK
jgi:hypothetical protein